MVKGSYQIPFDKDGNQLDYIWGMNELLDNFVFNDTLSFKKYGRGRSSITFEFIRESNGKTVSMFVSDFSAIVKELVDGKISGEFTFVKKGANFGCKKVK
jgi:hypothetical protein